MLGMYRGSRGAHEFIDLGGLLGRGRRVFL